MIATLLGTGTSTGVPPIGCKDPIAFSPDPKNRRLRAGLLLREGPDVPIEKAKALIVDCGPDFRQQALTHHIDRLDGVLLTHAHFDHISGIDDLRIYNFRQGHDLPMYGLPETLDDIRRRFDYIFIPQTQGGGVASLDLRPVDGPFEFLGMRIVPIPAKHGYLDILGYRFGDFSYVTDANYLSPESMDLLRGSRTLVLNMLRHEKHSTHYSVGEAIEVAQEIAAEQTYFVHMTHYLEHNETNALLPNGMQLGWDGLEFSFAPEWIE